MYSRAMYSPMLPDGAGLSVVFNPPYLYSSGEEFFAPPIAHDVGFATYSSSAGPAPRVRPTLHYGRTFEAETASPFLTPNKNFTRNFLPKSSPETELEVINRLTASANQSHLQHAKLDPRYIGGDMAVGTRKFRANPHSHFTPQETESKFNEDHSTWPQIDSKKTVPATKPWLDLPEVRRLHSSRTLS